MVVVALVVVAHQVALAACIMVVAEDALANALEAPHAKPASDTVAATGVARNALPRLMRLKKSVAEEFTANTTKVL